MNTHPHLKWPAIVSLAFAAVATPAQNLITNGDFESRVFASFPYFSYMADGDESTLPGWTVIHDGIGEYPYVANRAWPDYACCAVRHGNQGVVMTQGSGLRTTFPTVSNTIYELSFWIREGGRSKPEPLVVDIAGYTTNFPATTNYPAGIAWRYRTIVFTAQFTDPAARLRLRTPTPSGENTGWALDAVAVVNFPRLQSRLVPAVFIEGGVGRSYRIEYVDSLLQTNDWHTLTTIVLPSSPHMIFDIESTNGLKRFYRAIELP